MPEPSMMGDTGCEIGIHSRIELIVKPRRVEAVSAIKRIKAKTAVENVVSGPAK